MTQPGPICSACTRDWDDRLGYCQFCQTIDDEAGQQTAATDSDTPLYDQLLASLKLGPRRSNANTPGLWEDNFS